MHFNFMNIRNETVSFHFNFYKKKDFNPAFLRWWILKKIDLSISAEENEEAFYKNGM